MTERPKPASTHSNRKPRALLADRKPTLQQRETETSREGPDVPAHSWVVPAVRYALPAAVVLAGAIVMALGSETELEGGAGIVGAGVSIVLINLFFRAASSASRSSTSSATAAGPARRMRLLHMPIVMARGLGSGPR